MNDKFVLELDIDAVLFLNVLVGLAKESLEDPEARSRNDMTLAAYHQGGINIQDFIEQNSTYMEAHRDELEERHVEIIQNAENTYETNQDSVEDVLRSFLKSLGESA